MSLSVRRIDNVNWLGLATLCRREVRRFLKVIVQTVLAPAMTTLLFLAIFALALGQGGAMVGGVPFLEFLAPGLIMMAMMQNAFANTSSSLIIAKVQGNIIDLVMPPLSPMELTIGLAVGGVVRALVVGSVVALAMAPFVPLHLNQLGWLLYYGFTASLLLALLGIAGGLWSEKFEHLASVTNFVITPLSFLSGTFYSIERLPEFFRHLALANPFFHLIDGFRHAMIGHADGPLGLGALIVGLSTLGMALLCHRLFRIGYRLKS
jgi:ABC-2 type transport system permease protein